MPYGRPPELGTSSLMRFARLALFALLLAATPAVAQMRSGDYTLEGRTPEGEGYTGLVALRPGPGGAWLIIWQVGNTRLGGIGLIHQGVLAVAFEVNDNPGVAAYHVAPDGRLEGTWTTGAGFGSETLTPR